jgi:branched-chain amino acid transport system ATP-binding protein
MTLLETENLTKRFGELIAVDRMDFAVEADQISAVIGPNGAGKSTLFNLISGLLAPSEGTITYRGEDITGRSPAQIARLGIGRSFQIVDVFEGLTVRENVRIATQRLDDGNGAVWRRADDLDAPLSAANTLLEDVGLAAHADERADALSHGDRRKLDIALTMAIEPRLVLLDEPTAGMGKEESIETVRMIRSLSEERDITLVIIEHDLEIVLGISDVVTVMHEGRTLARGTPDEIRENEAVQRAYLGTGGDDA